MGDLKHEISPALVRDLARLMAGAWHGFPAARLADAAGGLEPLELMARNAHVAAALGACMPADFTEAADVMLRALAAPELDGWIALPCVTWAGAAGIDDPATALPLLAALTPRFSAEWAVRPFLLRHPEATWAHLARWAGDSDEHVRRLVSEGTRPRLPWTSRLRLDADGTARAVALLERLSDDPSGYVRRSVGNHLNDISRDDPALAVALARRWRAGVHGDEVARRGMRTLVAAGDPAALAALGLDAEVRMEAFDVSPARVPLGGAVEVTAVLAAPPGTAVVAHLLVHYRGADRPPKPFVLARGTVPAGGVLTVRRRHAFRTVSIRTVRPGPHRIGLQANGRVLAESEVEVLAPPGQE
ncbi:MAG: DNA alkylation repair protein [Thermoleophilia bacterium]